MQAQFYSDRPEEDINVNFDIQHVDHYCGNYIPDYMGNPGLLGVYISVHLRPGFKIHSYSPGKDFNDANLGLIQTPIEVVTIPVSNLPPQQCTIFLGCDDRDPLDVSLNFEINVDSFEGTTLSEATSSNPKRKKINFKPSEAKCEPLPGLGNDSEEGGSRVINSDLAEAQKAKISKKMLDKMSRIKDNPPLEKPKKGLAGLFKRFRRRK